MASAKIYRTENSLQHCRKVSGKRRPQTHLLARDRVRKADCAGMQQQTGTVEMFGKHAVVRIVTVFVIADDRVENMFEMPSYLPVAPGLRLNPQQRITGGRVGAHGKRQFGCRKSLVRSYCRLCRLVFAAFAIGHFISDFAQRIIDRLRFISIAAHDGEIFLADAALGKGRCKQARHFARQSKNQYS